MNMPGAIRDFAEMVKVPIEHLKGKDVQVWIDYLLDNADDDALDANTVVKYLCGLRNYWKWMITRGFADGERTSPFSGRAMQNAHDHVKVAMLPYEPADVVRLWQAAEAAGDQVLADVIKVAAYSGGQREGFMRLKATDIKIG